MPTTKPESIEIPYLAQNGRPFHKLSEGQRRWYTKGVLTTAEESELMLYFEMIEERVRHYQALRLSLRKDGGEALKFKEDTPVEERERRLALVEGMKKEYREAEESILELKNSVLLVEPGNLALPPVK
jgi:hypothetical protein